MFRISLFSLLAICLLFILIISWFIYRTTAEYNKATYSIGFDTKTISTHALCNGEIDTDLALMDEYAELSYIVYRGSELVNNGTFRNWKMLPILKVKHDMESGLHYEVWENKVDVNLITVAIVFKGTEDKEDWSTNSRWLKNIMGTHKFDYYDELNETAIKLVETIENNYKNGENIEIVATGHSLGGGLAQFMAYKIERIKKVYAFNSSPVTGYYDIERDERNKNKQGCKIYRIFESGEVLSPVRKLMTVFYPAPLFKTKNPMLVRIRVSFSNKNTVSQHSIKRLAENLAGIKEDQNFIPK